MKKILWLSRHKMSMAQLIELYRIYGNIEIVKSSARVSSAKEVLEYGKDCDILAVVLSDEILADLVNPKINTECKPVIRAVMKYIPIVGKTDKNGKQSNLIIYQNWEEVKV